MIISTVLNAPVRRTSSCDNLWAGVSLYALGLSFAISLLSADPAAAGCLTTGSVISYQCDTSGVNVQPNANGTSTLTVSDTTISSGWINYSVSPSTPSGPVTMTLGVSNTAVNANGNGAVNVSSQSLPATITVTLDSDVTLENTGGDGGLWVRNQVGGDITVITGASIISSGTDAVTATSNAGAVSITNTGTVTSTDHRGIYADGSPVDSATAVAVSVNNSGVVNAYLAGIRAIDYLGTARIDNSGTVTSTTLQGLIGWSQSGDVSIDNSGSVLARNYIGVQAAADAGNVTVVNSGYIEAQRDSSLGSSTSNQGIRASGANITVTNTSTGRVIAGSDTGIDTTTDNGTITLNNAGRVTGTNGITADATIGTISITNTGTITATSGFGISGVSGDGAVAFSNSGKVSATGIGVTLNGSTNTLTNAGTITTTGTTAVQTGDGDSTVIVSGTIQAASNSDTAIAMGAGSNRLVIGDTAIIEGIVTNVSSDNTLELNGSNAATLNLSTVGASGTYQGFANLVKSGTGTWTLAGSGSSLTGSAAINAGTLSLGGGLNVSSVTVGGTSAATLAVTAGGTLASAGATVSSSSGTAAVTVRGTGATWTDTGVISIGSNGTGSLTVDNGGALTSNALILGQQAGAEGTASVSGTNSSLTVSSYMKVGNLGTGSLSLSNGATATVGQVTYIGDFDNSSSPAASGSGSLTLSGTGTMLTTEGLYLRNFGAQSSSLRVTDGAVVNNLLGLYTVGDNSTIYVNGANSALKVGTRTSDPVTWDAPDGWFSPDGGNIEISGGALLDADGSYIGGSKTTTMLVTGAGTRWVNGLPLYIGGTGNGNAGTGTVTVSDGAYVTSATSAVGVDSGAVGSLTLTGTGTIYEVVANAAAGSPGNMRVGFNGTGSVTVSDGALLRAANQINIATNAGSVGVLSIGGAAGAAAAAAGTVDGGTLGIVFGDGSGKLVFNHTDTAYVFNQTISGTGDVVQQGPGTTILTGNSTGFTGATTVSAGTLQIGNGGTSGSIAGNITNNAALVFNRSDDLTYAGVISGSGSMTKSGNGTLILTGENTYSGGTTISAGTLQIGDGGTTGSIQGNVINNATLVFNRSGTYDFPGTITGSGDVKILGGSTVNFTGASGYNGAITISESSMVLANGSTSDSSFTIADGGTISGTGTIAGLTVQSGGSASPGYSPGTLTVAGNVTFNVGSVYNVDVTPAGAHDLISASGTATLLGGTVAVNATTGGYNPSTTITILQATGGVTGRFSNVTSNLAFLTPELSYDANDVYLTLLRNDITFASKAVTANQRAVASAAEPLGWSNAIYSAIANLNADAVPAAFDSLSGESYASASTVMLQQSRYLRDVVSARLGQALSPSSVTSGPTAAPLTPDLTPTVWMQGFGGWDNARGDGNASTISSNIGGVFGGADVALGDNWRVGLLGGYSHTAFDVAGRSSFGSIENYDLGAYAGASFGALNLKGGASYTWHDATMRRAIAFSGYSGNATGYYDAATTQVFGEASYSLNFKDVTFQPFAGLAYVRQSSDGFTESGSSAALSGNIGSMETVFTSLGLRMGTNVTIAPDVTVTPNLNVGWLHAAGDVSPEATMALASGSQSFGVTGVPFARDSAVIGAGLDYHLSQNAVLSANYSGQFAKGIQDNTVKLGFNVKF